ncbi:uncharacterized protein LOC118427674 isoform X1 [Branchiostoma floridae]|uniref:Uncharacterized protein LOC118427674 isoform X1 n=1 Tax=Branchiostoma floridae TaxID=7739 RepID=A0A9J7M2C9_BRAFL|nr:uncharacterized protein LOC118427674 isoform X1 [Branchiostoma floridae]
MILLLPGKYVPEDGKKELCVLHGTSVARHVLVLDWRGFPVTRAGAIEVANQFCWCPQHDEGPQCTLSFSATLDAVLSRGSATSSNGFLPSMKGNKSDSQEYCILYSP